MMQKYKDISIWPKNLSTFPLTKLKLSHISITFYIMNKRFIIALACIALLCGCQEREKTIYKVLLSAHVAELEQQERAYNDSLEKYSALLDTAQIHYYFDLHQAALASHSAAMRQEVRS